MKLKAINPGHKSDEYVLVIEKNGSDTVYEIEVFNHGGIYSVSFKGELRELQHKNPMPFKPVVSLITKYAKGESIKLPYNIDGF